MVVGILSLKRPLVVLDIEATGVFPARDRIVEIACIKIHPDGRREVFCRRVDPTIPIPEEAAEVHGIRDADVAGLPPFAEIAGELAEFLKDSDLAGYNIERFDLPILQFEFLRTGKELDIDGCAVVDSQKIFFAEEGRTLGHAMRFYVGEDHPGAHSALADAEATVRVLEGQLQRYEHLPRQLPDLAERYQAAGTRPIDPEARLVLKDGVPHVNFGKHRGKSFDRVIKEEPGFFDWILRADFSAPIKRYVEGYLKDHRSAPPAGSLFPER
jgi:DNA polymerase III subunit epsilon